MKIRHTSSLLTTLGFSHALVDAVCAAVTLGSVFNHNITGESAVFLILLYNILAFGMQAIIGFGVDRMRISKISSIAGIVITASSIFFAGYSAVAAVVTAGLGNAIFHVGGGRTALIMKPENASIPGVYVAPGAVGLLIGTLSAKYLDIASGPMLIIAVLSITALSMSVFPDEDTRFSRIIALKDPGGIAVSMLLFSIAVRSFIGFSITMPWKDDMLLLITLTLAISTGKAAGGFFADRFGWVETGAGALILSAPLISFHNGSPVHAIIGFMLFNMTMPVTLAAMFRLFPGYPGYSFGLTCLALITGMLPAFTQLREFCAPYFIITLILLSAATLYTGIQRIEYISRTGTEITDTLKNTA